VWEARFQCLQDEVGRRAEKREYEAAQRQEKRENDIARRDEKQLQEYRSRESNLRQENERLAEQIRSQVRDAQQDRQFDIHAHSAIRPSDRSDSSLSQVDVIQQTVLAMMPSLMRAVQDSSRETSSSIVGTLARSAKDRAALEKAVGTMMLLTSEIVRVSVDFTTSPVQIISFFQAPPSNSRCDNKDARELLSLELSTIQTLLSIAITDPTASTPAGLIAYHGLQDIYWGLAQAKPVSSMAALRLLRIGETISGPLSSATAPASAERVDLLRVAREVAAAYDMELLPYGCLEGQKLPLKKK
jgi:hypothetical protein